MSIHYNQVGYDSNLPKKAVLTGQGELCVILDANGHAKVCQPRLSEPVYDEASGDTVRIVDFSNLVSPGRYFLIADGEKVSIEIKARPYHDLNNALVKALYYQRCGCSLQPRYAGEFQHRACHLGRATLVKADGTLDENVSIECSGGWHDAGDYGRYVQPAAVAVSHILYAWERFPNVFNEELAIPESGNGVPDILNECRYELEWLLKMQRADGGVYHKVTTRYFAPFVMPEDDREELLLFDVSHCATACFAAVSAQAYRVYRKYNPLLAERLLQAAKKAWSYLEEHPNFVPFRNPPNVNSGEYSDPNCEDDLFWAACELYAATNEAPYLSGIKKRVDKVDIAQFGWRETAGFGALCCLFIVKDTLEPLFLSSLRDRFLKCANEIVELAQKSGYGTALAANNYIWGSILPILNNAIVMICAKLLTHLDKYQNAAQTQLDYLLGLNATGYSFVTGFGDKAFRFPHHRPSYADGIDAPIPGLVSGGPNKVHPDDAAQMTIPPDTPPAKFWIDHTPTASSNEIAIYWNSPAVFVAGYFDSLAR
jgi:endoglucanase